ncbi:MAG: pilus assembly FimT family protein [Patescibacteria group bacterium]
MMNVDLNLYMKKLSHPVFNNAIQNGFTLVELIVTISILAILGTIGFLSLQ